MSSKVKRKVTVENSKEGDEHPRRPSVFERLGPNAVNITPQPQDVSIKTILVLVSICMLYNELFEFL